MSKRKDFDEMVRRGREAKRIRRAPGGLEKWIGYVVKKGFPTIGTYRAEHMFVLVERVEGGRLVGILLNRPFYATYLHFGDVVEVEEDEISEAERPEPGFAE